MSKQKKIILISLLLIVLLMGIGYAAITNVTLTITGTASAKANQDNFKVYFTGTTQDKSTNATVTVTAEAVTATVNFTGLTKKDDTEYAILEILNDSNDIDAESITVALSGTTNTDIIEATAIMCDENGAAISDYAVASQAKTYVKVSAKLLQTPTDDVSTAITATITAKPADVTTTVTP